MGVDRSAASVAEIAREAGATTAEKAAESIGVELRGEDGQPYCCGERMHVKGGIFGVDYAHCETCRNLLYRIDSPHTNGGLVFTEEEYAALGDEVWIALNHERDDRAD